MLKCSVIIPAYNEGSNVLALLNHLFYDVTRIPDEVIVIDANSTDNTLYKVKQWQKAHKELNLKIIELTTRSYPGRARNEGVKVSSYDYIVFIDCSIYPEKDWLEKLLKPFEEDPKVDVVWGKCSSKADTLWEKAFATLVEKKSCKNTRIVPSSCIKKDVFWSIGGFREDLRAAEDLLYKNKISTSNLKEEFVDAMARYTGYPKNLVSAFKKWSIYTKNDVYAELYKKKLIQIIMQLIFYSSMVFYFFRQLGIMGIPIGFLVAVIVRCCFDIYRSLHRVGSLKELLLIALISLFIDTGRITGMVMGLIKQSETKKYIKGS